MRLWQTKEADQRLWGSRLDGPQHHRSSQLLLMGVCRLSTFSVFCSLCTVEDHEVPGKEESGRVADSPARNCARRTSQLACVRACTTQYKVAVCAPCSPFRSLECWSLPTRSSLLIALARLRCCQQCRHLYKRRRSCDPPLDRLGLRHVRFKRPRERRVDALAVV